MKLLRDRSGGLPIKLIIIILAVAVLGGGGFMMMKKGKKGKAAPKKVELSAITLDEFMVNLADQDEARYLKVNVVLEVEGAEAKAGGGEGGGKEQSPEDAKIRDTMISVFSSKHFSELLNEEGKDKLKDELKQQLNKDLEKMKVHNIYFTSFAMQ